MNVTIEIKQRSIHGGYCVWLVHANGKRRHIDTMPTRAEAERLVAAMQAAAVINEGSK